MRFMVHRVKELYPDLQKYGDSRVNSVSFQYEHQQLVLSMLNSWGVWSIKGYTKNALLYYLSHVLGSEPPTGLLLIDDKW